MTVRLELIHHSPRQRTDGGDYPASWLYRLVLPDGCSPSNGQAQLWEDERLLPAGTHVIQGRLEVHTGAFFPPRLSSDRPLSRTARILVIAGRHAAEPPLAPADVANSGRQLRASTGLDSRYNG